LLSHAGQVLSRDQLMDAIHDREWTPNDRTVDVLVGRVRRKLDDNPADPRRHVQRAVSVALFSPMPGKREPRSILAESLDGVDRALLYPAVRSILENEDGATRSLLGRLYGKLDDRDIAVLLPAIVKAIREPSPSDEMFADSIRLAGLDLLSRLRIREGMALCVDLMEPNRWGQNDRIPRCCDLLARYGAHAKSLIPKLKEVRDSVVARNRREAEKNPVVLALDKAIARIEANQKPPSLLDLKDFRPSAPPAN